MIVNKLYKDWSPEIKRKLRNLTLKFGTMRHAVSSKVCDTFVMLDNDLVIGWAIYVLEPWYKLEPGDFMLYVRCTCRRKGVGRSLIRDAVKKYGSLKIHIWDECSGKFYSKMCYSSEFYNNLEIVRGHGYLEKPKSKELEWKRNFMSV